MFHTNNSGVLRAPNLDVTHGNSAALPETRMTRTENGGKQPDWDGKVRLNPALQLNVRLYRSWQRLITRPDSARRSCSTSTSVARPRTFAMP
jgi:hypothetical protein